LKAVNDTRGHAAGDLMLVALADVLRVTLRNDDFVFRYGGERRRLPVRRPPAVAAS
jgi:diguanylate cyclase (GGDEF)-like protein